MTASGHALIGAAIITKIPDLRISLPLILVSHIVGDAFAHWDFGTGWEQTGMKKVFLGAVFDLSLSFILVTIIFIWWLHFDPVNIYLGTFVSLMPDFLEFPYFFLHWKFAPWTWVNNFNQLYHKKIVLPWNFSLTALNQIILSGLFILWSAIK